MKFNGRVDLGFSQIVNSRIQTHFYNGELKSLHKYCQIVYHNTNMSHSCIECLLINARSSEYVCVCVCVWLNGTTHNIPFVFENIYALISQYIDTQTFKEPIKIVSYSSTYWPNIIAAVWNVCISIWAFFLLCSENKHLFCLVLEFKI